MKRPTINDLHGSHVTTPHQADLLRLLGGGMTLKSVLLSRDEMKAVQKLYGFKEEKPRKRPPAPKPPKEPEYATLTKDSTFEERNANYNLKDKYEQALKAHKNALQFHANWTDPSAFYQAGADRNAFRYAEMDGLRLVAWLAKHLPPGADPLKTLIQLAKDARWDVDPEDADWSEEDDEPLKDELHTEEELESDEA